MGSVKDNIRLVTLSPSLECCPQHNSSRQDTTDILKSTNRHHYHTSYLEKYDKAIHGNYEMMMNDVVEH